MGNSCFKVKNQDHGEAPAKRSAHSSPEAERIVNWTKRDLEHFINEKVQEQLQIERGRLHLDSKAVANQKMESQEPFPLKALEELQRGQVRLHREMHEQIDLSRAILKRTEANCQWNRKQQNLRRLIQERAAEKLKIVRATLQHDLDVIAKRRKNCENEKPFPEGMFETLQMNDVWGKVLLFLNDPSDITSAYFACPFFAEILEERRKLIFLSGALKILLGQQKTENDSVSVLEFCNLRGVSRSWKKIADREMFDADFLDDLPYLQVEFYHPKCFHLNERNIDRALELLCIGQKTQTSFFRKVSLKRCAPLEERDEENLRSFCEKVLRFLDVFGDCIWHFDYIGNKTPWDWNWQVPLYEYGYVREMLLKMPALKSMDFCCVTPARPLDVQEQVELLNRNPFPELQHLARIGYSQNDGKYLLEHIYQNCPNLTIFSDKFAYTAHTREMTRALLEHVLECCVTWVKNLDTLRHSTWPLRVLKIVEWPSMKCSELWPVINKFSGTLEKLSICSYQGGAVLKDGPSVSLRLPRLKVLELSAKIGAGSIGFDDLLPLKSLEEIEIQSYNEEQRPDDREGLVQIFGMKSEMEKSNIWSVFPHLKRLMFGYSFSIEYEYIRNGTELVVHGPQRATTDIREIFDDCRD